MRTHVRRLGAVLILSLLCVASSAPAQPEPAAPPAGALADLQSRLSAHVNAPRFAAALWSVKVVSLETGRVLFEHDAGRLLSPASNSKLYSGALLLDRLGPEYRIRTPLLAATPPGADGVLSGDLIVAGRGDPSWNPRRSGADFASAITPFVDAVANAGIRRITGDVVADATHLRSQPFGAGWTADDLNDYYGAEISAVTLDDNYADIRVTPGASAGEPCALEFLHPHTGLELVNHTSTAAPDGKDTIRVMRLPDESVVHIFGTLPAGAPPKTTEATVPRPAAWFARALKAALVERGIRVDGAARSVRWPEPSAASGHPHQVAEIVSPPLRELVNVVMKASQNLHTDLLFAHLGEQRRSADTPHWRTSEMLGIDALEAFLARVPGTAGAVIYEEGSGLSRNNLNSAAATVALMQFMAGHAEADAFFESLPVAGSEGTLRRRFKGTRAEGNLRAKTGTLRWAHSLSGHVTSADGERIVFSAMLNRYKAPEGRSAREEVDAIGVMLANHLTRE